MPSLQPCTELSGSTVVDELRTAKMAPLGSVLSAIDQRRRNTRLFVSLLGIPDDEHDLTFHGGPDKAIHQYCSDHYPFWTKMYPEQASGFVPGGFGENVVAGNLNERNICIGDVVQIGSTDQDPINSPDGCLLEVSLPRQPCFKLNQRFGIKDFAPKTHRLAMTGWYYRVKTEGWIKEGMVMRIVERKYPRWTIENIHHYVHREKNDLSVAKELMTMPELGDECKNVFSERWRKYEEKRLLELNPKPAWQDFIVVEKSLETPRIMRLDLRASGKWENPQPMAPGSSISIKLANGLKRFYSVVGGHEDQFILGVARDEKSRGGSVYIHDSLTVGETSEGLPVNKMASHHVLFAGGIGITAFISMMHRLRSINQTFQLHYSVRTSADVAFSKELQKFGDSVKIYDKSRGERVNIAEIMRTRSWNSHFYICGPIRMIDAVVKTAADLNIPEDEVHFEHFKQDHSGDPFSAEVRMPQKVCQLQVGADESLVEAMRRAGLEIESSCEVGNCGTCRIPFLSGRVEHKGTALTEAEKEKEMLSCVSRGVGHLVVEISNE